MLHRESKMKGRGYDPMWPAGGDTPGIICQKGCVLGQGQRAGRDVLGQGQGKARVFSGARARGQAGVCPGLGAEGSKETCPGSGQGASRQADKQAEPSSQNPACNSRI